MQRRGRVSPPSLAVRTSSSARGISTQRWVGARASRRRARCIDTGCGADHEGHPRHEQEALACVALVVDDGSAQAPGCRSTSYAKPLVLASSLTIMAARSPLHQKVMGGDVIAWEHDGHNRPPCPPWSAAGSAGMSGCCAYVPQQASHVVRRSRRSPRAALPMRRGYSGCLVKDTPPATPCGAA